MKRYSAVFDGGTAAMGGLAFSSPNALEPTVQHSGLSSDSGPSSDLDLSDCSELYSSQRSSPLLSSVTTSRPLRPVIPGEVPPCPSQGPAPCPHHHSKP